MVRDGLVVDFVGATDLLRGMKRRVERRLGRELTHCSQRLPARSATGGGSADGQRDRGGRDGLLRPDRRAQRGQPGSEVRDGAIVDVGGGTTGIAIVRDGKVIYTADEPTGGTHFSLVVAGALNISFEEAEALKVQPGSRPACFPLVRPVMEKVGSIILRQSTAGNPLSITLVGGTSAFRGDGRGGGRVHRHSDMGAPNPLFVTPLGLALHDPADDVDATEGE